MKNCGGVEVFVFYYLCTQVLHPVHSSLNCLYEERYCTQRAAGGRCGNIPKQHKLLAHNPKITYRVGNLAPLH